MGDYPARALRFVALVVFVLAVPVVAHAQARRDVEVDVAPGETLWSLSRRFDVPIGSIRSANSLHRDELRPGQHLRIPGALAAARAAVAPAAQHVVREGETFSSIATVSHVGVHALQRVNPGVGERDLRPGMTLVLPEGATRVSHDTITTADGGAAPPRSRKQRAWIARAERLGMGTTRAASQILAGIFDPAWKPDVGCLLSDHMVVRKNGAELLINTPRELGVVG